ncbi:unnamed protein product [Victoria cruziana]
MFQEPLSRLKHLDHNVDIS